MVQFHVQLKTGVERQRSRPFGEGPGGQQHAPDIGMNNDGISGFIRVLRATECSALQPLMGKNTGSLISRVPHGGTLNAGHQSCGIHHGEHVAQASVFFPNQLTYGLGVLHLTGGRRLNAHFLFNALASDPIVITQRSILIDHVFGDNEQTDPAGARRCIRGSCQNEVDDVVG